MSITSDYANTPSAPPGTSSQGPGFFSKYITNPIKSAFSTGASQVGDAMKASQAGQNPLESAIQGGEGIANIIDAPFAPLSAPISKGIQAATSPVVNAISNNPGIQKFAQSKAGQTTARVAQDVGSLSTIAGTAGAFEGARANSDLVTDHPIFKPGMKLEAAQNDLNMAGEQGVQAQNQMNTQAQEFNTGLGQKFVGAASQVEQASPGLKLNLPAEAVDALREIKSTKNFSIPQDILDSIPDIKQVGEGTELSLNPSETQDLIKQLNRATYSTKANGDLNVNQKLVNLTNAIKDSANDTFGGVKDANGNSIWQGAYKEYAAGKLALDKISDIVDIHKGLTASDLQGKINTIKKLGESPSGRVALKQAVEEFKKTSGIDLTNPTQAIQDISAKEEAVTKAGKPGFARKNIEGLARYGFRYLLFRELIKAVNSK